eukprot:scaffold8060_cov82-Phaeocystis_antarctica.AAC.1
MATVSKPQWGAGRRFKRRAHPCSLIRVHVGVDQCCRAFDVESSAPLPNMSTRNVPLGRWRKCLGKGRRRAHRLRGVRIHVGVGQRCRAPDVESPAILPIMNTRNVPAGQWKVSRFEIEAGPCKFK